MRVTEKGDFVGEHGGYGAMTAVELNRYAVGGGGFQVGQIQRV
jgi:hypothetical protein